MIEQRPAIESDLSSLGSTPTQWERIEHHTRTLDRAIRITQMSDAKVAPILALHVSLAAVTVTRATNLGELLRGDGYSVVATVVAWALLITYALASLAASFFVAAVYVPAVPRRGVARTHFNSLFYFDDIQAMPVKEFEARSVNFDMDAAEKDVIHQAHQVSKLASVKLLGVQHAYLLSAVALLAWLPLMLIERL